MWIIILMLSSAVSLEIQKQEQITDYDGFSALIYYGGPLSAP